MKKLFNSRFLFILASSLVVLILLIVGAFYLFDDKDDTFVKSGYVLNPLSSTSEKYFFDENVGYKENLSSMIEFIDVDEKTVSILKDSFIHYLDESMSLLKNGAILDLDSVDGKKAVSFYNITNESIIEKKDNGYVIESKNGEIKLNNFIARISDNKYIVVGNLSLKMAGNATTVKGDYFEIVYVEEGIVNIENKDVKYQVAADNTFVHVGNDTVIDLGNKKITVNDVDVMSITAITIDGDENIEIIPKGNDDEEEEPSGGSSDVGNGGSGGVTGGTGENDQTGTGDGTGNNPTDGTGDGGTGNENVESDETEDVTISLKDAKIGSTNIDVIFDVVNAQEDDKFMLQVVSLSTGRTVDMTAQVMTDVEIKVNLLTPNTKYLFMVVNEKDNAKYFQKVLETTGFGIKLEKSYATAESLAYNIVVEEGTDISNAKLSLYKFNEDTMKNEIVMDSYVDSVTGETKTIEKVFNLSSLTNIEGEHQVIFDGLDSNTIYTAVLDEFSVASTNFKDIYNVTLTSMTLKQTPAFNEMVVSKDVGEGSFDLSFDNIDDPDNAIVSYTYMIYDMLDNSLAVEPIVHKNASPITVKVGDKKNELKNDTNYYYKVIIEYYDNEKYIEYVTTDSISFMMGNDPYITVIPNEKKISYDSIGATIVLRDNSCLISMPDREKCSGTNSTVVEVSRVNPITGERTPVYTELVEFEVSVEEIVYELFLDGLQAGTTYSIDVKANLNNNNGLERQEIMHTSESKRTITTKSLASFKVDWSDKGSTEEHVVSVESGFVAIEGTGSMSPEESAASIKQVVISLYEGNNTKDLDKRLPIVEPVVLENSADFNIKDSFFDNRYLIDSLNTFGLTMQDLIDKSKEQKLNEYYTILVEAYFDTERKNPVNLDKNVLPYKINPQLIGGQVETILEISEINNSKSGNVHDKLINGGTLVGYSLTVSFDRLGLGAIGLTPKKLHFYVYDRYSGEKLAFYTKNENGELVLTSDKKYTYELDAETSYYKDIVGIYMDYGTPYEVSDEIMSRGNTFYIGYEIESVDGEGNKWLNTTPLAADGTNGYVKSPTGYGVYKQEYAEKETPTVKMYIAKSTADSVTYNYEVKDPDNAIYKEPDSETYGFYTSVNSGTETKVDMEPIIDAPYNQFAGKLTIIGMKNGDIYSYYYKKNSLKTGEFSSDVLNVTDGNAAANRIFDGFYDLDAEVDKYNFRYQIVSDSMKDNRLIIKLLFDDSLMDRILSYKVNLKDSNGKTKTIELGDKELKKLSICPGDSNAAKPRCLAINYTYIKEMKSDSNKTNLINVGVTAIYDNGLTGYDYKVGDSDDADYLYTIMQDNSSSTSVGNYIGFTASGQQVSVWSDTIEAPKGYYTYELKSNGKIFYRSKRFDFCADKNNPSHCTNIDAPLGSVGYASKYGVLNPKMVSVDEMSCFANSDETSCNSFSFSSITPKIMVTEKSAILNGAVMNFNLVSADIDDIKPEDGKHYLYVETWDSSINAGKTDNYGNFLHKTVRPTVKVEIDEDDPSDTTITAVIDGLKEYTGSDGSYYFTVYAYLLKGIGNNGEPMYERTQLCDAGITDRYETKIYSFKSAKTNDLFHSLGVSYTSSEDKYGDRTLNTKINLLAYKNNVTYNFDLIYVMCEIGDADTCGPNDNQTKIFRKDIPLEKLTTKIEDGVDISQYDLEYGKDYHMWVYANIDYYDYDAKKMIKRNVVLNRYNLDVTLQKLTEPTFTATRNAVLNNGEYAIDFNVNVKDNDRTLVNGKYYVKLLDLNNNLVGNMQLIGDDGSYYDITNYEEYEFKATDINKHIRITGLDSNTEYTFVVYGDVYLNNYSEEIPKEKRIYEKAKTYPVFTTNDYGVAFGTASYGVTENAVIVTFLGGSNFANVTEVMYTVGVWNDNENTSTKSGSFIVGQNNKYFELSKNSEDWSFLIDPKGMKNVLGKTYMISMKFKVKDPLTNTEIVLTSLDVPSFEGSVTYINNANN